MSSSEELLNFLVPVFIGIGVWVVGTIILFLSATMVIVYLQGGGLTC